MERGNKRGNEDGERGERGREGHKREREECGMSGRGRGKGSRRGQDGRKENTFILLSLSVQKLELFAYKPDHNKSSLGGLLEEKMG